MHFPEAQVTSLGGEPQTVCSVSRLPKPGRLALAVGFDGEWEHRPGLEEKATVQNSRTGSPVGAGVRTVLANTY